MNTTSSALPDASLSSGRRTLAWRLLLVIWILALVFLPDPRPLGAPDWAVSLAQLVSGGEGSARVLATLVLRAGGLGLLGALLMLAFGGRRWGGRSFVVLLTAPLLAILCLWLNYRYFPIPIQLSIAAVSAALGAVLGLALRLNWMAAFVFVIVTAGLFLWGTSTGIDDELDHAARLTGRYLLEQADRVPEGDAGFEKLLELAFSFAEENSHGTDPVLPNRAAILALGVILGGEPVAHVAKRQIDPTRRREVRALRVRVTVHGRKDWSRHFWTSAALTLLSDDDRSIAIGLTKELMDAMPGGSGFSFTDLAVDAAGNLFALAATRDAAAARNMQAEILAGVVVADVVPEVIDLPEGLTREDFLEDYGGLGGAGTNRIVEEIRNRLSSCPRLEVAH